MTLEVLIVLMAIPSTVVAITVLHDRFIKKRR